MSSTAWEPSTADRLRHLREKISNTRNPDLALELDEPGVRLGISTDDGVVLSLECDPESVVTDQRSNQVHVVRSGTGAVVRIAGTVPPSTTTSFIDDVLGRLADGRPRERVGAECLANWRDLLARAPGPRLGERELAGLFGELEVLEQILSFGGSFDHWTGWNRDHVDFRLPGLCLEVKTTLSPDYRRVRIHGLQQLADPEDGSELILVLRRLESSPEGRSVPDVIDDLAAAGLPKAGLLTALHETGYSEEHRSDYLHLRFVSEVLALRRINDSHPRLTPAVARQIDLDAIDRVDYVLNLNDDAASDLEEDLASVLARHLEQG